MVLRRTLRMAFEVSPRRLSEALDSHPTSGETPPPRASRRILTLSLFRHSVNLIQDFLPTSTEAQILGTFVDSPPPPQESSTSIYPRLAPSYVHNFCFFRLFHFTFFLKKKVLILKLSLQKKYRLLYEKQTQAY